MNLGVHSAGVVILSGLHKSTRDGGDLDFSQDIVKGAFEKILPQYYSSEVTPAVLRNLLFREFQLRQVNAVLRYGLRGGEELAATDSDELVLEYVGGLLTDATGQQDMHRPLRAFWATLNEVAQILREFWRQLLIEATWTECIVNGKVITAAEISQGTALTGGKAEDKRPDQYRHLQLPVAFDFADLLGVVFQHHK